MRSAALVLAILLASSACDHRPRLRATKRNLTLLPLPWRRPSINIAEDGAHVTYAVRDGDGYHVVTPQGAHRAYREVSPPLFAAASDRVFYWGMDEADGRRRFDVVAAGTSVPTPFAEPIELVTARGGARWAASGFLEADAGTTRTVAVVVDGREAGRYAAVTRPDFSPDGAHVAWIARDARGGAQIVVDGAVVQSFDATPPADDGPRFDTVATARYLVDGRLIVLVPEGAGWSLYRDRERLGTYGYSYVPSTTILLATKDTPGSIVAASLVTATEAPVAVWWERMAGAEERWRVVRDGAPVDGMVCDRYWDTQPPVLTADGAHVAYVCPTPTEPSVPLGRRWVMLDGRRFGAYIESWTLGIAPDGTQVAYGAADTLPIRQWRVYVNGIARTPAEELVWRPRFSPDGSHVLSAAGPERGRRRLRVDGRTVTRFDDVMYGPEFVDADTAVYVIRRGRKVSRVEVSF